MKSSLVGVAENCRPLEIKKLNTFQFIKTKFQNLLIFYTNAFGFIFPAIIFLILLHILNKFKFRIETIFFLMMVVFVFISPIEEVNSFYGLIFGFLYKTLFNKDNEKI